MRIVLALPLLLVMVLSPVPSRAQATAGHATAAVATDPPASGCAAEFRWVRAFAERNYAGYEYKLAGDAASQYADLVAELAHEADRAADGAACTDLLIRWAAFFRDGHLSVSRRAATRTGPAPDDSPDAIRARYANAPRRAINEAEARARLDRLGSARNPVEGIWEMQGGNYRGVVLRDAAAGTTFRMSILRADSVWWVPGQVKAHFTPLPDQTYGVRFLMRDHSEQRWVGRVQRNVLTLNNGSPWLRVWPVQAGDLTAADLTAMANGGFAVSERGPGTLVLQIPSFNNPRAIDSLFAAEGARIAAAERLVIDVRGNGGGSDHNFRQLLPLIYTGPIRMVSNALRVTDDNIAANAALAADTTLPEAVRNGLRTTVERMRETPGEWYEFEDYVVDDLTVREFPRRVDVIVDRGCASSCEQFLLAARQSRKVTIYGTHSAGILDFGNVRQAQMPHGTLVLNYPTTRSRRLPQHPVDGVGIPPDVPIPAGELDGIGWVLRQPR